MVSDSYSFDTFRLDAANRQLTCRGKPVDLNARYLDALVLLVREAGRLVSKDRFLEDVWRGVPVTDEALTQCIKTLRRQLGDDAARPRFIETVPKHGYRFIAPVRWEDGEVAVDLPHRAAVAASGGYSWREFLLLGAAGTVGGGVAGLIGGLFYGFAGASQPLQPGMGAVSVLLVLMVLTILLALLGAAGVAFGIAASGFAARNRGPWTIIGGAGGGLIVGAFAKLVGMDALNLLFGWSPGDITGAAEGALLGAAVGLGAWLASRGRDSVPLRRSIASAAIAGGCAGLAIVALGGRMLGGSLDLMARGFPGSRLRLDQIGALLGEQGFGPVSALATAGLEGLLFGGCVVGAMVIARRSLL